MKTQYNKLFIFFGIPGSGKSYLGRIFAQKMKYVFYEADEDYSHEMRNLSKKSNAKKIEVNKNFYDLVKNKTKKLLDKNNVVIANAMGSNVGRKIFLDEFGDRVVFIMIDADNDIRLKKILSRELNDQANRDTKELEDSLKSHLKKKIKSFEEPSFEYIKIRNNYDDKSINKVLDKLKNHTI